MAKNDYISLQEATKNCDYSQEYLSLRARQGKLKAIKFGRNWVTKKEWLDEYLKNDSKKYKDVKRPAISFSHIFKQPKLRYALRYAIAGVLVFSLLTAGIVFGKDAIWSAKDTLTKTSIELFDTVSDTMFSIVKEIKISSNQIAVNFKSIKKPSFPELPELSMPNISIPDISIPEIDLHPVQDFKETMSFVAENSSKGLSVVSQKAENTLDELTTIIGGSIVDSKTFLAEVAGETGDDLKYGLNIFQKFSRWYGEQAVVVGKTIKEAPSNIGQKIVKTGVAFKQGYQNTNNFVEEKLSRAYKFLVSPWGERPEEKEEIVVEKEKTDEELKQKLEVLQARIEKMEREGLPQKEIIKEIQRITQIEPIKEITKELKVLDEQSLAEFKTQLAAITGWEADIENLQAITKKLQATPPQTVVSSAPIYIGSQGVQVGGHGSFASLGVSGSAGIGNLGVGDDTALGGDTSDKLTVAASSTFNGPVTINNTLTQSTGDVILGGNVDATAGLDVTGADLTVGGANFTVDTDGNVIVAGDLTVTGAQAYSGAAIFTVSSSSDGLRVNQQGTGNIARFQTDAADNFVIANGGQTTITSTSTPQLTVAYDSSNYLTVACDSSGNITFTSPASLYDVFATTGVYQLKRGAEAILAVDANGAIALTARGASQDITITPSGTGNLNFYSTSYYVSSGGELVIGNVIPVTDSTYNLGSASVKWQNIYADNIYGTISPSGFTQGSVIFANSAGSLAEDNSNLFWDDTNNRLGVGTTAPLGMLSVAGSAAFGSSYMTTTPPTDGLIVEGRVGIGVSDPDTKLEIYNAGTQLKLSYNADDYATFAVDDNGDLTVTTSGDEIFVDDHLKWTSDDTYDIGASGATRPATGYFGTSVIVSDTTAGAGSFTLYDAAGEYWSIGTVAGTLSYTNPLIITTASNSLTVSTTSSGDLAITSAGSLTETFAASGGYTLKRGTEAILAVNNSGAIDLTARGTNQDITITPSGTGNLNFYSTSYYMNPTGDLVIGGRFTFESAEYISNETDGYILFQGSSAAGDNTDITFNLDGTYPIVYSATDSKLGIDDDLEFIGAQTISTSSGDLTFDTASKIIIKDATIQYDSATQIFDLLSASGSTTLQITNSDGTQVANLDLVDGSLYTAGTQRITNAGNLVNIGSVSLSSTITMADDTWIGLGGSAGRIEFDDQGTDEINILNANVGIGTSAPLGMLSVAGSAAFGSNYMTTTPPTDGLIVEGRVGIGDSSPDYKLDVVSSDTTGLLELTGDSITTGTGLALSVDGLTTGTGLDITSTSTAGGTSGASKLLNLSRSGANTNASHTTYGLYSSVANTGTSSINIAGYFTASGADTIYGLYSTITAASGVTGYGLYVDAGAGDGTEYAAVFMNGNVGIGTATPTNALHVLGQCVTGDTLLPILSTELCKSDMHTRDLEFTRIDEVKSGQYVLSLNEKTGQIEPAEIKGLLDMGVKPVFKLTTESGRNIRTTGNHPYLVRRSPKGEGGSNSQWTKVVQLQKGDQIAVADLLGLSSVSGFQDSINNNCASQSQNCSDEIKNSHSNHIALANKTPNVHNKTDITAPKSINQGISGAIGETKTGIITEAKNMCPKLVNIPDTTFTCSEDNLSSITFNDNNTESDVKWEKITSIEYVGEEQVYDIEVKGTHNFVAGHWLDAVDVRHQQFGGIIAHNTYIETTSTPQLKVAYDSSHYLSVVVDNTGDLTFTAEGGDISFGDENLTTIGSITAGAFSLSASGSITMADDTWIGLASDGGRLVFDSTPDPDTVTINTASLLFSGDNTYDIGASGATRPANIYTGTSVVLGAQSSAPATSEGKVYFDNNDKQLKVYDSNQWVELMANYSNHPSYCPDGYVPVPGDARYGTEGGFCVMKYETKCANTSDLTTGLTSPAGGYHTYNNDSTACTAANSKQIVSVASGYPIAYISQTTAQAYCESLGPNYHLITNAEWMTVARNAEQVSSNWFGGTVGTNFLYSGHNDETSGGGNYIALVASSSDASGYYGTGDSDDDINPGACDNHYNNFSVGDETTSGRACAGQRRTLTLSNGKVIWDLSGNVWEWNEDTVHTYQNHTDNSDGYGSPTDASPNEEWVEFTNINDYGSMSYSTVRPSNSSWNSTQALGKIYTDNGDSHPSGTHIHAFIRGGRWDDGAIAGVFTLYLNCAPSYSYYGIGFRCASSFYNFTPLPSFTTLNVDDGTLLVDSLTDRVGIGDTSPVATLTVGSGDKFQVAGGTGNITTAGDLAVNGGDITTTATAWNFDLPASGGTIYWRDGTNNLMTLADSGDYGTLTVNTISPTTINAFAAAGTIDMSSNIITNIGNTGTDFVATTGALNLAGALTMAASANIAMSSGTGQYSQTYTGTGDALTVTSSGATDTKSTVKISQTGATSGTDYGLYVTNTGAATTNIAGYFSATGATNNYSLMVAGGDGDDFATFAVDTSGDLTITMSGSDLLIDDNLWVCSGSCPFASVSGTGNLIVEGLVSFDSDYRQGAALTYKNAYTVTVGPGEVIVGVMQDKAEMRKNETATDISILTSGNYATGETPCAGGTAGSTACGKNWFVYAVADTSATTFTVKLSQYHPCWDAANGAYKSACDQTAPSGLTKYRLLGYFQQRPHYIEETATYTPGQQSTSILSLGNALQTTTTATDGTTTTLVSASAGWTIDAYAHDEVIITSGTGAGQWRNITSNTADTLTIKGNTWTAPGATSVFDIVTTSNLYMYLPGRYVKIKDGSDTETVGKIIETQYNGTDNETRIFFDTTIVPAAFNATAPVVYSFGIIENSITSNTNLDGTSLAAGIPLPGMVKVGDIAVDIYEASDAGSSVPASMYQKNPWKSVNQYTARIKAEAIGKRLIKSAEWTMAGEDTPDKDYNYPGGVAGAAQESKSMAHIWNTASGDAPASAEKPKGSEWNSAYTWGSNAGYIKTGTAINSFSKYNVYDLIGNQWEWTDDTMSISEIGAKFTGSNYIEAVNSSGFPIKLGTGNKPGFNYDYCWNQGSGYTYGNCDGWGYNCSTAAFIRGGGWSYGASAGVFALFLDYAPSYSYDAIGFRCAR